MSTHEKSSSCLPDIPSFTGTCAVHSWGRCRKPGIPSRPSEVSINLHTLSTKFAAALLSGRTLSDSVTDKAKYCLLDYLASAYSTQQFHWVINARDMVLQNSGMDNGGAALIGSGKRASLQDAAFVNAVAGHSLVRDDMHLGSVAHLGVVVIPPALALAENRSVSGETLLEAIVAGYEAGGKLGRMLMDVQTAKKIRPTGLIGAWAAAATGSVLLGMNEEQAANALGLASNYFIGLNEWAAWGSEDMYFHPGIAVRTLQHLASIFLKTHYYPIRTKLKSNRSSSNKYRPAIMPRRPHKSLRSRSLTSK
ncbi:MAG: hypothetical protein EBS81_07765 [Gammaproteobacteria bacterium]|nr:hypothetical protein [Gammaproteobacteria bacterium]